LFVIIWKRIDVDLIYGNIPKIDTEELEKPQKYEPIITACFLQANSDTAGYDACYATRNIIVEWLKYRCCFINLFTVHILSLKDSTVPRLEIHKSFIFIQQRTGS